MNIFLLSFRSLFKLSESMLIFIFKINLSDISLHVSADYANTISSLHFETSLHKLKPNQFLLLKHSHCMNNVSVFFCIDSLSL